MNRTYAVECNPWHIFVRWHQLLGLYSVFMMKLNSFITFPTCNDVLDCFDGNKAVSQALMFKIVKVIAIIYFHTCFVQVKFEIGVVVVYTLPF